MVLLCSISRHFSCRIFCFSPLEIGVQLHLFIKETIHVFAASWDDESTSLTNTNGQDPPRTPTGSAQPTGWLFLEWKSNRRDKKERMVKEGSIRTKPATWGIFLQGSLGNSGMHYLWEEHPVLSAARSLPPGSEPLGENRCNWDPMGGRSEKAGPGRELGITWLK